ncbi:RDD family protein [Lysobacter sp. MMG2]|uniref:RDD family protein n=1 Tax=Lysobacter sp. MMG2 TaxID=2801338 RepID=UPI001C22F27E|nr:RDD family protein [Lysobacter sp. MMG2]MBU8977014.1 RDD family protein [Lysobacter sp. MMG2]
MLDTYREVVTPEGVALHLPAAGPVPRALAWLIDFLIRAGVMIAMGTVLGVFGRVGMGVYAVVMFLVFWFYPVVFEAMWDGRTPGKRSLGLRVIAANGAPVGWLAAFTRNLLRVVDMLPLAYATGLVASLLDPWGRRLGDMVAGTLVVHDARPRDARAARADPPLAPSIALRPHEQIALVAFAERGPGLSEARQAELADLAEPLTGARGTLSVTRLYGMANWLLGRR